MLKRLIALLSCFFVISFYLCPLKIAKAGPEEMAMDEAVVLMGEFLVETGAQGELDQVASSSSSYAGSLWNAAQTIYYGMDPTMATDLQNAITRSTNGYMMVSSVPGLSDYFNNEVMSSTYINGGNLAVPTKNKSDGTTMTSASSFLDQYNAHIMTVGNYTLVPYHPSGGGIRFDFYSNGVFYKSEGSSGNAIDCGLYMRTDGYIGIWCNYTGWTVTMIQNNGCTKSDVLGNSAIVGRDTTQVISNPITSDMAISIPANPLVLNHATPSTVFTNIAGVSGTILGSTATQALGQSAADAATAAYNAAIAAGLSVEAAQQAAKAASAAIAQGLTLSQALAAGNTAAQAYEASTSSVTDVTGSLSDGITNPIGLDVFKNTMAKLNNFNTAKGSPPKITVDLNSITNSMTPFTHISNPFSKSSYTFVDFAYLDTFQFLGYSVVDYFRLIIGFGFILETFLYCYRRTYSSGGVIS